MCMFTGMSLLSLISFGSDMHACAKTEREGVGGRERERCVREEKRQLQSTATSLYVHANGRWRSTEQSHDSGRADWLQTHLLELPHLHDCQDERFSFLKRIRKSMETHEEEKEYVPGIGFKGEELRLGGGQWKIGEA